MKKNWKIAVAGEVYIDHIFTDFDHVPSLGEEVFAEQYRREAGGGTVNTACALARLGHETSLFGVLGDDEEVWLRKRLVGFGVDAQYAQSSTLPNALTISMSTTSDRSFLSYAGANALLESYAASPLTKDQLCAADHVHFAMPLSVKLAEGLLPELRAAGCTLSMDPGWRKDWFEDKESLKVLRMMDLFFPNESEARLLTGKINVGEVLQACKALGLGNTVIKLGPAGAAMLHNGSIYSVAPPSVEVVDTTGAGDAFDAGFLDAWLEGATVEEQLRRACFCGSLSTRSRGALSALPFREDLAKGSTVKAGH